MDVRGLSDNRYCVCVIPMSDNVAWEMCQKIRHSYFVVKRGWVTSELENDGCESDGYDPFCHHLGVFEGEQLLAYLRVLPWHEKCGFMLEHEFAALLSTEEQTNLERPNSVEVSRLVISPLVPIASCQLVVELLLKRLYHLANELDKPIVYLVVEADWLAPFVRRFRLPLQRIGHAYIFPDGTQTVAAVTNIRNLEAYYAQHLPDKLRWYQNT